MEYAFNFIHRFLDGKGSATLSLEPIQSFATHFNQVLSVTCAQIIQNPNTLCPSETNFETK